MIVLSGFQTLWRTSSDQTESLIMVELCAEFVYFRYSLINHQVTRSYCQSKDASRHKNEELKVKL